MAVPPFTAGLRKGVRGVTLSLSAELSAYVVVALIVGGRLRPDEGLAAFTWVVTGLGLGLIAAFVDFCNSEIVPGIEMSGGYGLFQQGGRLPAHLHDFDESICIVQGTATCFVEGRRYTLENLATALQPRGRVHYFINEAAAPMAMIWFYGGPLPERIVVDESCAREPNVAAASA